MPTPSVALRLAAALALMLLAFPAAAQESPANAGFSEATLDAFADAAIAVSRLMIDWRDRLQTAENQAEQEAMIEQANDAITAAIEAADGINIEEYEAIADAAEDDPAFAQALEERVRTRLEAAGPDGS